MKCLLLISALVAAFLVPASSAAAAWTWPVAGEVVTTYRNGSDPYASGQHRGIDIAADVGRPVVAATDGTVTFAGSVGSSGLTVGIRTADGAFATSYLHLESIEVRAGDDVSAGARVGTVGTTGRRSVERAHLHFGVRDAGTDHAYRDPLEFLPPPAPPPLPQPPPAAPVLFPVVLPPLPEPASASAAATAGPATAPAPVTAPLGSAVPGPVAVPDRLSLPLLDPAPRPRARAFRSPGSTPAREEGQVGSPAPGGVQPAAPRSVAGGTQDADASRVESPARHAGARVREFHQPGGHPRRRAIEDLGRAPVRPAAADRADARDATTRGGERSASRGDAGVDVGWAVACAAMLLAALALGHPRQARRTAGRGWRSLGAIVRPLLGRG